MTEVERAELRQKADELFLDIIEDQFLLELGTRLKSLTAEQTVGLQVSIAEKFGAFDEMAEALGFKNEA